MLMGSRCPTGRSQGKVCYADACKTAMAKHTIDSPRRHLHEPRQGVPDFCLSSQIVYREGLPNLSFTGA